LFDNTDFLGLSVTLHKVDLLSGNEYEVFKVTSGMFSMPGEVLLHDSSGTKREINNNRWAWYLLINFEGAYTSTRVYSIRIKYK